MPSDPAGSGGSGCVSVESEGEQADTDTDDHEQTAVRFKVETEEDGAGDDKMRLHRRDTPHHLKNKRINQQVILQGVSLMYPMWLKQWGYFLDHPLYHHTIR